jgi:hypothetical protein
MFEPNETLREIVVEAIDNAVVIELYADDAAPPFNPSDAIKRFSATEATTFLGLEYEKKVIELGKAKRTSEKEINSFQVTFDNLDREIASFELNETNDPLKGFEGKILVGRLISRSLSVSESHSLIFFCGRCKKPEGGDKEKLAVTAEQIFGTIDKDIPRRKFTPEDPEGRAPSDPLFEGFPIMPQYGVTFYTRVKKYLFGLIKKRVRDRLQWSSFSDIDASKDLPVGVGRVQVLGTHLGYADVGNTLRISTAFLEGEIKAYLRVFSTDPSFTGPQGGGKLMRGELGGVGDQTGVLGPPSILPWVANGLYSRTAVAFGVYNGTDVETVDPAPDIAATVLALMMALPDSEGNWTLYDWTDNPAAVIRHFITAEEWENLDEAWLDDEAFLECFKFNDEFLFDNTFSDLIFLPEGTLEHQLENKGLNLPTNAVTPEYLKHTRGELSAEETFYKTANFQTVDLESVPIDPDDLPDPPDDPGDLPSNINLSTFLRRRYTVNGIANEKQPLWDWLNESIMPAARMLLMQGFDGRVKPLNKKPVDFALGLEGFTADGNTLEVDDVSSWIAKQTGFLLIQPHSNISEVRKVVSASYSSAQNSVSLSASSNISVSGFSGANSTTPATATLTINSVLTDNPNYVTLDNEEIAVYGVESDDSTTLAGFFYGSINAHPRLRRKFKATWQDNEVTVTAKFGTLTLDSNIEFEHPSPVDSPTTTPSISADSGNLRAGLYFVAYAYENANGRTLISPANSISLSDNQKIIVDPVFLPTDATSVIWYVSPEPNSKKLRKIGSNDGSEFEINALPKLTGELPNDFNRTGTEVLRVMQVFADNPNIRRTHVTKSNVLKSTYSWRLGRREDAKNTIVVTFRDATQDFRLVELRVRDDEHIKKVRKENKEEIDGSAIDNFHQAFRIASGALAEIRDADFFYKWQSDHEALFLEEADVVCVTDAGAGVVNFPVIIEPIEYGDLISAHPTAEFVARKYSSTLYDDSVVDRQIPVFQSLDEFVLESDGAKDFTFTNPENGVVMIDRETGTKYRVFIENGVIELEEVPESAEVEFDGVMF